MSCFNKFSRDLKQGQLYEEKARGLFKYKKWGRVEGYFKDYDFWLLAGDKKSYFEVKSDKLAAITGNLCIEYGYKGNPSGITATKADYYIYYVLHTDSGTVRGKIIGEDVYIIPVAELREIAGGCRSVMGGDGKHSKLYLVDIGLVSKYRQGASFKKPSKTAEEEIANMLKTLIM
jgi:hypothetical protein